MVHAQRLGQTPSSIIITLIVVGIVSTFFVLLIYEGRDQYGVPVDETIVDRYDRLNESLGEIQNEFQPELTDAVQQQEGGGIIKDIANFVDKAFTTTFGIIGLVTTSFGIAQEHIEVIGELLGAPNWLIGAIGAIVSIIIAFVIVSAWRGTRV